MSAQPPAAERPPLLRFDGLVKQYRAGESVVRAVDDVSLDVAAGELVALYGPSGSGKSTLLLIAAALTAPDRGRVVVDGRVVTGLGEREAADYRMLQLGFVPQQIDLLGGATAVDNAGAKLIGMGLGRREARRRVQPLLEELGLADRLRHRPDQLSMGERQRVMIARALSTEPRVVLADEPTGALDSERKRETLALLRRLTKDRGMATLLVTHDGHAVDYADRVHVLRDGRLVAADDHDPVLPLRQ
ncbi:ABC transporter ATP-binding protein [Patulibacter defluvii]|uniref:ABC transporter ATP-binding protein n=1 Tax=Patulibacter defluvii TaxID=3095358 RepID=UPI002A764887|nr:ATP-binding cassette domain-containing protein [Patulibacter sp. DM4]